MKRIWKPEELFFKSEEELYKIGYSLPYVETEEELSIEVQREMVIRLIEQEEMDDGYHYCRDYTDTEVKKMYRKHMNWVIAQINTGSGERCFDDGPNNT